MRTLARIAIGAGLACAIATALLVVVIFVTEWQRWSYSDEDATYVAFGLLLTAPIVGGWWAWVRS